MKIINQHMRVPAVSFATKEPEELAGFYQRAFNIPVAKKVNKDHLGIELANLYLGFDRVKDQPRPDKAGVVVWFEVDNVEEAYQQLIEAGAKVRSEVNRDQRPGYAMAVFYDPDGNLIGLIGPSVPSKD